MIRTQIQLTEEQSTRLREVSRKVGVSTAEIIRRSIDLYLESSAETCSRPHDRLEAIQVVGRFHSGLGDVASRHDDYLDEAYAPLLAVGDGDLAEGAFVSAASPTGIYLDTSALYAVFDGDDRAHPRVARAWDELLGSDAALHTSSYVLVEMSALLQHRLGVAAVDAFATYVLPWVHVSWVDDSLHAQAVAGLLAAARRDLTLVDCTGFVLMRRLGLRRAFTLDRHFAAQGFEVVPGRL